MAVDTEIQSLLEEETVVEGAAVKYLTSGAQRVERPAVVLVHGTGGNTESHFPFLFPMLARDQRVVSVELAEPEGAERLDVEHLAAQVAAVIREAVQGPVTLVGYSLGAVVAAAVAGSFPELASRLVLVAGWMRTDPQQRVRNELWTSLRRQDDELARRFSAFTSHSPSFVNRQGEAEWRRLVEGMRFDRFFDAQMDLNRRVDITDLVERISAQTLVVSCTDDQMVPRHHAVQLFGAIEDARMAEVAAGHAVVLERPAELVHLINQFSVDPSRWDAGTMVPRILP
jgi:pimeloyl-ACP methyl ester carboxylesterase